MVQSTQSHSVRQEGGQPFGLVGAKEMIFQVYLQRYLYYSTRSLRETRGRRETIPGSPKNRLRRLLEAWG